MPTTSRNLLAKVRHALVAARGRVSAANPDQQRDAEAGDTLIEVLIALVVLGIAVVAMLLAFGAALSGSAEHRTLTNIATAKKTVTQQIVAQLQNANPPLYLACASATNYQAPNGSNAISFTNLPTGYSAQVSGVGLWDASDSLFDLTQAACQTALTASNNQSAPQLISATVTYPSGGSSVVTAVVNNPASPTPPAAGAAAKLFFYTQPGGALSAQNLAPQPVVEVEDAQGTAVTTDLSDVVLSLTTANGGLVASGTTLSGCVGSENGGYVTFTGCNVNKIGTYALKATDSALGANYSLLSNPFTISTGPPSQIVFTQQPSNSTGGTAFATQPQITVEDAGGNTVTTDTSSVSLAVTTGSGPGTLTCTPNPLNATAGVANFSGCSVNTIGTTYTLTATDVEPSGTLTATSAVFTISVGSAAKLAFTPSPGASTSGHPFGTQPVVTVEDAGGNTVNSNASITLAIASQPTSGATFSCTGGQSKNANAGVATFSGCTITNAAGEQGNYTLKATSGTLTPATSLSFTVAGGATQLVFQAPMTASTSGSALTTQPVILVEDSSGDLVTTATNSITLAIASQPTSGATFTCTGGTLTKAATAGVATFSGCTITNASGEQGNYTVKATTTGGPTQATSNSFSVAGTATKLIFFQQPTSSTGGVAFPTQPVVKVEDSSNDVVTSNTSSITLAITPGTGTTGAALSCTSNPLNATAGVATFAGCSINLAGTGYTIKATDGTLTAATSNAINITVGPASTLAFTTQPGGGANAVAWTTQPTVTVEDAGGNKVVSATNTVSLTIGTQPGTGATLGCTTNPVVANAGVATFAGCEIVGKAGTTYKLTASSPGLANGTSAAFSITVGAAYQVAFTTQPGGGGNTTTWTTQPVVTVQDSGGNTVATNTTSVMLAIAENAGGTLGCTHTTVTTTGGVATFAGCEITGTAGTYTLSATSTGLASGTSSDFSITAGPASQVVFSTQPGGGADGSAWTVQPAVSVEDVSGNLVGTSTANITLNIHSQPGSGATLGCTNNPLAATGGVATFANCEITGQLGSYTLSASATGLASTNSNAFTITIGNPTKLAFTTQPGGGVDGATWGTQPAVSVEDPGGNVITTATNPVTLALGTNPGGTLNCTTNPLNANTGVASFAGCEITGKTGTYTVTASSTGLTSATSSALSITLGPAAQLAFTTQPGGGANTAVWTHQPVLTVQDVGGNTVTSTASITLALGTNPGGALNCTTNPLNANAGVASFAGCKITGKAGTYTLTAAATGFTTVTSNTFTITFGAATQIAFSTQPGGGADGTAWGTQPAVSVEDASGNVVTNATNQITLALGTNPGGALACTTNPLNANAGVASFAGCKITGKTGTYTLTAAATGFTTVTSNNVSITIGGASQLAFSAQPGGGANGAAWGTQPAVTIQDAGGNVVTNATNQITLALGTNPGGTLACTPNPLNANAGVASFAGCKITGKAGTYTLTASATGLAGATSNTFTISFGAATQIAFSAQPGGGANGAAWGTQPAVSVEDASGNVVTSANNSVTLAIGTNPGGTLACSGGDSLAANAGTASFAGCEITGKVGTYTLTAAATGFTTVTSSTFTITFGPGSQLVFSAQPGGGADGTAWGTQPAVTIEDESGNVVTNATNQITLALGTNPGGTLNCTTNPLNANAGVASFAGCEITGKTGTYTLTAAATGFTTVTSNNVPITIGGASQLVFTTQPGGGVDGTAWGTQPKVTVEDAGGNTVTTANNSITLAIATQPGTGATLACSGTGTNGDTLAATNGLASFAGCKITGKIGSYTINATASGLAGGTSLPLTITIGTASELAFSTQPGGGASGAVWTTQPVVSVADVGGNPVNTGTNTITLAIASQPGTGATLACTGGDSLAATNGVANFAGCKITIGTAGTYTLSASTTGGLTAGTSAGFTVYGTATKLVFTTQPGGGTSGAAWTTQPVVSVEDAQGDVVANSTASITLAIASQPFFGSTLTCTGGNTLAATNGVASFAGCEITDGFGVAGSYTISAKSTGLATATSSSFTS
jgi:Tfp pilus assembly protein PilV